MANINFKYDKIHNEYIPTLYPGESSDNWEIPEVISSDFTKLNSIIETKYSREYLKVCAFYNKMFPSLKVSEWAQTSYNVPAFTFMDQERTDTGTGTNYNYLKQIVDQLTSRLGTITFVPMLLSEDQSFEYIVYQDEVERILRKFIRNDDFNRISLESFHDGAILGYSHVFIDPYTGKLCKASDFEIGIYESQFSKNSVVQMLYRDYAFPTVNVINYLCDCDDKQKTEILESLSSRSTVDFKMYFDCAMRKVFVTINDKTLPPHDYDFDHVIMTTFQWDTGVSRQLTTSMFDTLYPIQREINKIAAKVQQLVRMYKGATPVFNSDVDLVMKSITNGSGEALYVDSSRPIDTLMTVINPTPLDPQLSAQIQEYKTIMYELAGIQNATFDMENMRSAAAVVALDQTRDSVFQAQMSAMAQFVKNSLMMYITFFSKHPEFADDHNTVDWDSIGSLIDRSYIDLKPVHLNDPVSDEEGSDQNPTNFNDLAVARVALKILKGEMEFDTLPYYLDNHLVTNAIANLLIKFSALGVMVPDTLTIYLINAFIHYIQIGELSL